MNIKKCFLLVLTAAAGIAAAVSFFNFAADPYYIFRHASIYGFNDKKPCMFYNRENVLYSDLKLNGKSKTDAFIGSPYLYRDKTVPYNIAFYTIPGADIQDLQFTLANIITYTPDIKRLYLGVNFSSLFEKDRSMPDFENAAPAKSDQKITLDLFLSLNTLKDSIKTVKTSFLNRMNADYVYPYQETAFRTYSKNPADDILHKIKALKEYAIANGINIILFYPPSNVTYKIDVYEKGFIENYMTFKKELAQISPYYDYSLNNEFNMEALDGTGAYYRDSVHITDALNGLIVNDIITGNFEIGVLVNKDNADAVLSEDLRKLQVYMEHNQDTAKKIRDVKPDDAPVKIKRAYRPYSKALL